VTHSLNRLLIRNLDAHKCLRCGFEAPINDFIRQPLENLIAELGQTYYYNFSEVIPRVIKIFMAEGTSLIEGSGIMMVVVTEDGRIGITTPPQHWLPQRADVRHLLDPIGSEPNSLPASSVGDP
jgi:hypothetical protein